MVVSASPNQPTAAVLSGIFYTMWSLFSGFIIPRPVSSSSISFHLSLLRFSLHIYDDCMEFLQICRGLLCGGDGMLGCVRFHGPCGE